MKKNSLFEKVMGYFSIFAFADTNTQANTQLNTELVHTVYSKEIEFKALPNMRFMQFAATKTELGTEPGLTISMLTYDNLKMGGQLSETASMTTQGLSGSTKQITVTEWGNAVQVSEKLLRSSFDDVMSSATTLLGRDYAMVADCALRDTALSGTNVVYAKTSAGAAVASRDKLDSTCMLKVSTIKDAVEVLATGNAPKVGGTNWICFVHPHQSRSLRDDSAWIEASKYGAPEQLFTGEIGRIDDVRFIETTILKNGASATTDPSYDENLVKGKTPTGGTVANTVNVYQATLFGDAYYGIAYGLPVELRDNGVEDFGRKHSLAWYSIFGVGKLHDQYGVVIETA
jgi:N4-gp56 family major capsid protein